MIASFLLASLFSFLTVASGFTINGASLSTGSAFDIMHRPGNFDILRFLDIVVPTPAQTVNEFVQLMRVEECGGMRYILELQNHWFEALGLTPEGFIPENIYNIHGFLVYCSIQLLGEAEHLREADQIDLLLESQERPAEEPIMEMFPLTNFMLRISFDLDAVREADPIGFMFWCLLVLVDNVLRIEDDEVAV